MTECRGHVTTCCKQVACLKPHFNFDLPTDEQKRGGGRDYPCKDYVSIFIYKNFNYNKIVQFYCIKMYLHNPYIC